MGRGLSDHQRTILRLANENRTARALELPRYRVMALAEGDNGRERLAAALVGYYDVLTWRGGLKPQYTGLYLRWVDQLDQAEAMRATVELAGFTSYLGAEAPAAHITVPQVLCDVYGLYDYVLPTIKRPICFENFLHEYTLFNIPIIGKARKNAASVGTSKALGRLCERKLLIYVKVPIGKHFGYALTSTGVEAAQHLMVNADDNITSATQ